MDFKFGYKMTGNVKNDIDDIISYIEDELSNPKAALDFWNKVKKAIDELRTIPYSGSAVSDEFLFNIQVRKKWIDNYVMYYLPVEDEKMIYILRIVYGRRNMDDILEQIDL